MYILQSQIEIVCLFYETGIINLSNSAIISDDIYQLYHFIMSKKPAWDRSCGAMMMEKVNVARK